MFLFLAILVGTPNLALAKTIRVPSDQKKISSAIAKASYGDTILAASGTYEENIVLKKGIVLLGGASANYAERDPVRFETIIQGKGPGSVVRTSGNEDKKTVLEGFTITKGRGTFNAELSIFVGGGLYVNSSPTITNNRIVSNGGDSTWGGGVYFEAGEATFVRNRIEGNLGEVGAGILCYGDKSAHSVTENIVSRNASPMGKTDGAGGGICVLEGAHPVLEDNKISENGARCRYGGGVWISGANPVVSRNLISSNSTEGGYGGGLGCQWSGCLISKNIFEKNLSGTGGGIWCSQSTPEIRENIFVRNVTRGFIASGGDEVGETAAQGRVELAVGKGGGVACQDYSNARIEHNRFEYNSAIAGGAVSVFAYSSPIVRGNTMVKNRSESGWGAGIQFDGVSSPTIDRNIIANSTYGYGIYCEGRANNASISCNNVWRNAQGNYNLWQSVNGDISEDPLFCDEFEGNYYLDNDSPCRGLSACGRIGAYPVGCVQAETDTTFTTFSTQRRFKAVQSYGVSVEVVKSAILDVLRESGEEIDRVDRTIGVVDSMTGQTDPRSFLIVTKERKSVRSGIEDFCTTDVISSGPWRGLSWTINILVRTMPVVTVQVGAIMKTTESYWAGDLLPCYSSGKLERQIIEKIRKKIHPSG
ncbi:MAG: right-handed parallel beta-helix repeat-containing protein [Candidatus Eisenbacteria bacterium]|nr:right-handed parallel beta-helix repeat-containing protein [Candidatus Eisenbacteria bacterium]